MTVLSLRPAEASDRKRLFEWRNDPFIVSKGTTGDEVTWDEHTSWLEATLGAPNHRLYIVELEGHHPNAGPIGQVRFDREGDTAEISIYLTKAATGRGYGVTAIRRGLIHAFHDWPIEAVRAVVREDNHNGQRAFEKAGFNRRPRASARHDHRTYALKRPGPIPHNRLTHGDAEKAGIQGVVESGHWAQGPRVDDLEARLRKLVGRDHAVAVGSGLSALRLTLHALGVLEGDDVLVPAYACVALPNACLALGASPIPVDIDPTTLTIDPEDAGERMTAKTKAIIAVHTFGETADAASLSNLGVPVVEDCAHALGPIPADGGPGRTADVAVTSFYATKLVGGGEGGAVLTDDPEIAASVQRMRDYTDQPPDGHRLNDKMTDLSAALTLAQIERLANLVARRKAIAKRYDKLLGNFEEMGWLRRPTWSENRIWYRYTVRLDGERAERVVEAMDARGIAVRRPVQDWREKATTGDFPATDAAFKEIISLPLYPTLEETEQDRVVDTLAIALQEVVQ